MVKKYGENQALLKWIKNGEQFDREPLLISSNDRIVFGHPAIGKSYLKERGRAANMGV